VLETSGVPAVLSQAILSSAVGGEIGIVGAPPMGATVSVDVNFLLFNRKLRGIVEGQSTSDIFIPRLVELYRQGKFPFDKLIKFYSLDEINQASEDSEKGTTLKPVLRIA
jgi:aryl-alcohol dehydrogenase